MYSILQFMWSSFKLIIVQLWVGAELECMTAPLFLQIQIIVSTQS